MRACEDDPLDRVATAVRLGIGLKYTTIAERDALAGAAHELGVHVRLAHHKPVSIKHGKRRRR